MTLTNKIKEFFAKYFNWGQDLPKRVNTGTGEYIEEATKHPVHGRLVKVHYHNSKYLPDGTKVVVGSAITEYDSEQAKAIIHNNYYKRSYHK